MPKIRTYEVSFVPATITDGGYSMSISLMASAKKNTVEAASFPDLETKVRALARDFGQTCKPLVSVPKGERRPPGFDAFYNGLRVIEFKEEVAA